MLGAALLLAALDGYDSLSMAFVAPAVSHAWALDKAMLGLLLSSGLVGMAVGALALAPLADTIGRRPVVIAGLVLLAAGSFLSGFAHSVAALVVCRVLTGFGIGAMITMTTLLSAEFSSAIARPVAVAGVATLGLPLGGIAGGLVAAALLRAAGWPWVFFVGAAAGTLLLAGLVPILPESPAFIVAGRAAPPRGGGQHPPAGGRPNPALAMRGHPPLREVPPAAETGRRSYAQLFAPDMAAVTMRLIAINLLVAMPTYYLLNWLPQLVADAGFPPATGSLVSALSGLIGLGGGVSMGALAGRLAPTRSAARSASSPSASFRRCWRRLSRPRRCSDSAHRRRPGCFTASWLRPSRPPPARRASAR